MWKDGNKRHFMCGKMEIKDILCGKMEIKKHFMWKDGNEKHFMCGKMEKNLLCVERWK